MTTHQEMPKKVVVTGGAGFIGSHLCEALLDRGDTVICVDNLLGTAGSTRNIDHLGTSSRFEFVTQSVLDWSAHADLTDVDCVFHQAASKKTVCLDDPELDLATNGLATLRLLRKAAQDGVAKFVHASTGSVFGDATSADVTQPVSFYGVSKLTGESYCRVIGDMSDLDYTVLRYYHVVGPRQDSSSAGGVVPIFVRQSLAGEPLTVFGSGEQTRSFTSVHDVVRTNLFVADSPLARKRFLTVASGISVTIQELAEFVLAQTGNRSRIEYGPATVGDIMRFEIDNSELSAIGLEFNTDWRAMVREVIDSHRPPPR